MLRLLLEVMQITESLTHINTLQILSNKSGSLQWLSGVRNTLNNTAHLRFKSSAGLCHMSFTLFSPHYSHPASLSLSMKDQLFEKRSTSGWARCWGTKAGGLYWNSTPLSHHFWSSRHSEFYYKAQKKKYRMYFLNQSLNYFHHSVTEGHRWSLLTECDLVWRWITHEGFCSLVWILPSVCIFLWDTNQKQLYYIHTVC